jgi:hypothetical protein
MANKKVKVAQRIKLICTGMTKQKDGKEIPCQKEFSTHSTNRTMCHTCKPKCIEKHYFQKHKQMHADKGAMVRVKS